MFLLNQDSPRIIMSKSLFADLPMASIFIILKTSCLNKEEPSSGNLPVIMSVWSRISFFLDFDFPAVSSLREEHVFWCFIREDLSIHSKHFGQGPKSSRLNLSLGLPKMISSPFLSVMTLMLCWWFPFALILLVSFVFLCISSSLWDFSSG